jgi:cytosine deaminase
MLDLLITNATLPDGRTGMSIAVQNGKITAVEAGLQAPAHETVDAAATCSARPSCDPHFHMDATLSYGLPRVNESGTLLEGIALWGELKPLLKAEAMIERALAYCDWAVARACWPSAATSTPATPACWRSTRCLKSRSRSRPTSTCNWSPSRRTACCAPRAASTT